MAERRGGWPGPRKVQRTIDWPPEQYAAIGAYAKQHGIKFAEAVRRLVAAGLAAAPGQTTEDR